MCTQTYDIYAHTHIRIHQTCTHPTHIHIHSFGEKNLESILFELEENIQYPLILLYMFSFSFAVFKKITFGIAGLVFPSLRYSQPFVSAGSASADQPTSD